MRSETKHVVITSFNELALPNISAIALPFLSTTAHLRLFNQQLKLDHGLPEVIAKWGISC